MDAVDRFNRPIIWSKFVYDYSFEMDYGKTIKVTVDFLFDEVAELETLSGFPHQQRRRFAKHILQTYPVAEKYHSLVSSDILNPFAQRLEQLFPRGIQVYWTMRPTDTILIITGSVLNCFVLDSSSETLFFHCALKFCLNRVQSAAFDYFDFREPAINPF